MVIQTSWLFDYLQYPLLISVLKIAYVKIRSHLSKTLRP